MDPKVRDLYTKFDRSCVSSLIESVMSESCAPAPAPAHAHAHAQADALRTDVPPRTTIALFTPHDAHLLVSNDLNHNGDGFCVTISIIRVFVSQLES